jgi:O-antigen/teichoic acid export membrane protein
MLDTRRILKNFTSAGSMRIGTAAISLFFFLYVANVWGVEFSGEVQTVFAYFIFLQQAPLLGLHVMLTREVAGDQQRTARHATNALVLAFAAAPVIAVALGLLGEWRYSTADVQWALWLVGMSMFPTAVIAVIESVLIGQEKVGLLAIVNAAENLIRVVLSIAALSLGYGLVGVFGSFLLARVIAILMYARWSGVYHELRLQEIDRSMLRSYLAACPIFLGILVLSSAINRIDTIMLSNLGNFSDVGIYTAAYKIYEICLMVPSIFTFVLFPTFARYFENDRVRFDELARHLFRFCVVVGIPFSVAIAFFSEAIVGMIFKPEYADSARVLQLLIFIPVIVGLDQILTMVLLSAKRQGLDLNVLAMSTAAYLTLLFVLIPRYAYLGAAAATLTVAILQMLIRYAMVQRSIGIPGLLVALVRPLASAIVMAGIMASLRPWPVSVVVGFAAYVITTWLVGAVTKRDLQVFGKAFEARKQVEA